MADITADTSSYPKPVAPPSLLDVAQKVGNLQQTQNTLQQQQLGISQAKLDQANQALGYMTRAMGSLGPNATKDQYIGAAQTAAKMGLVPPETVQIFASSISTDRITASAPRRSATSSRSCVRLVRPSASLDWHRKTGRSAISRAGLQPRRSL